MYCGRGERDARRAPTAPFISDPGPHPPSPSPLPRRRRRARPAQGWVNPPPSAASPAGSVSAFVRGAGRGKGAVGAEGAAEAGRGGSVGPCRTVCE